MGRTFVVAGLGTLGAETVRSLSEGGATVIAVDKDEQSAGRVKDIATQTICVDLTNEEALEAAGLFEADVVILALRRQFETAVLATNIFKTRGLKEIIVHVDSEQEARAIRAVGATSVIFPERDMAKFLAERLLNPEMANYLSLGGDASIIEIPCPDELVGRSLDELQLRKKYGITVIALKTTALPNGETAAIDVVPSPDAPLTAGMMLIIIGRKRNLDAFNKAMSR